MIISQEIELLEQRKRSQVELARLRRKRRRRCAWRKMEFNNCLQISGRMSGLALGALLCTLALLVSASEPAAGQEDSSRGAGSAAGATNLSIADETRGDPSASETSLAVSISTLAPNDQGECFSALGLGVP